MEITEDITLYAIWEINSYTISFNGNGGSGSMSDIVMTHGSSLDEVECEFTAPAHYHFAGWSTSTSVDDMVDEWPMVITSDVTLYALWAQDTYQIQLHRNVSPTL